MSDLRFYGASDDLVEVEGVFREEYPLPYPSNTQEFTVTHDDGSGVIQGCRVRMRYTDNGTWAAEVAQLEEGFPIIWPTRIEAMHEYSVALHLDVPMDVVVEAVEAVEV